MKRYTGFTIAVLTFWMQQVNGQNVTIDKEPAPVAYYRLPDKPLDPSVKTYSADIIAYGGDLIRSGITTSSLESDYMRIDGYEKELQHGDVHIEAVVSDFTVFSERRESRQKKSKDKDGKETTTTVYWIEVKYALPVTLNVSDKKGRVLDDRFIYTLNDQRNYSTPTHNSIGELDTYWRINRTRQLTDLHKSMLTDAFKKIRDVLNYTFGYMRITNENARFETIGKKKHPEYQKYRSAYETIKKGFELMDPDKSLDPVRKSIEPALVFYKTQEKTYTAGGKEEDKLKHMCLYNLALAYLWTEDFEQAAQYAREALTLDDHDKEIERLLDEIDDVQASMTRANKPSRHMLQVARS